MSQSKRQNKLQQQQQTIWDLEDKIDNMDGLWENAKKTQKILEETNDFGGLFERQTPEQRAIRNRLFPEERKKKEALKKETLQFVESRYKPKVRTNAVKTTAPQKKVIGLVPKSVKVKKSININDMLDNYQQILNQSKKNIIRPKGNVTKMSNAMNNFSKKDIKLLQQIILSSMMNPTTTTPTRAQRKEIMKCKRIVDEYERNFGPL